MSSKRVYGIDLGTTYSCIARVDEHGKPAVLNNAEGQATTPSVVWFESANNIVVGEAAKAVVAVHPDLCVSTVKRVMGDPHWEKSFDGQRYKPQEISALILRKVVGDAETLAGEKIEDVVITCPAYFGVNEKEATKQAGVIAGLNVLYVIPEPTAAALAYGIDQDQDQVILVYDLGGGTFDITVIEIKGSAINVVCTGGDKELGGKNWDDAIVDYFTQCFENETGTPADSLLDDPETRAELLKLVEETKKRLSSAMTATEVIRHGVDKVKVEISRGKFDEITSPLLARTLNLTGQVLGEANSRGYARIDKLLLVGGSTYMPQVINAVKERFPFEVRQFDPNQAVAKGAAIFGHICAVRGEIQIRIAEKTGQQADAIELEQVSPQILEEIHRAVAQAQGVAVQTIKRLGGTTIRNVTSKSFGMVAFNSDDREMVFNLVKVNDAVPRTVQDEFYTRSDGQLGVEMRCMENTQAQEQVEIAQSKDVGSTELKFERPLPAGTPIEVIFELGADGLLSVHGREKTAGREIYAEFKTEGLFSHEELQASQERNLRLKVA